MKYSLIRTIWTFLSACRRNEKGMASVEFTLVLPLMLAIYFGVVEASRLTRASQKVDQVADMIADLTARKLKDGDSPGQAGITDADLDEIFLAARMIIAPLPASGLRLEIDELQAGDGGRNPRAPKVMWWAINNNPPAHRECGALSMSDGAQDLDEFHTIPTSLAYLGTMSGYIVSARAQYDYGATASPIMFGKGSTLVKWSYKVPRIISTTTGINPLILKATPSRNVKDCYAATNGAPPP